MNLLLSLKKKKSNLSQSKKVTLEELQQRYPYLNFKVKHKFIRYADRKFIRITPKIFRSLLRKYLKDFKVEGYHNNIVELPSRKRLAKYKVDFSLQSSNERDENPVFWLISIESKQQQQ